MNLGYDDGFVFDLVPLVEGMPLVLFLEFLDMVSQLPLLPVCEQTRRGLE